MAARLPTVHIIEQPSSERVRYRYSSEGRYSGSLLGESSTPENKTYPTIQVVGYRGNAVVIVSCVTKDKPYRPHPHNLVGRNGCVKGVCKLLIPTDTMTLQFSNLGIQCARKKDIMKELLLRQRIRVDPYETGFDHLDKPATIDLSCVRLCFQVFLEGNTPGQFSVKLKPVVSKPIYDSKAMNELRIFKLSHCTSCVDGGKEDIILLCEKVAKNDIQIRFYEENGGWEAFVEHIQVHKQNAIYFKAPKYKTLDVTEPVKVNVQLIRPSDKATSLPVPFQLLPRDARPFSNPFFGGAQIPNFNAPNVFNDGVPYSHPPSVGNPSQYNPNNWFQQTWTIRGLNASVTESNEPVAAMTDNSVAMEIDSVVLENVLSNSDTNQLDSDELCDLIRKEKMDQLPDLGQVENLTDIIFETKTDTGENFREPRPELFDFRIP